MGRFYFTLLRAPSYSLMCELLTDVEGARLTDALEAREMAMRSAREILADAIRAGKNRIPEAIVIADEQGRAIETVPLAVPPTGRLSGP